DAEFRGVQEQAIEAVIKGRSPVLVVIGTGGGKSIVFIVPAMCTASTSELGTTVIVVLLISLRENIAERCRRVGISAVE
ncbi:uncharacterized protein K452DRAFT_239846, partial [Aplosporella prunicola CBS 121167]